MPALSIFRSSEMTRKVNLFCLLVAMAMVWVFPLKKDIWYDETVSILCSKGISHDAPALFSNTAVAHSEDLHRLNTIQNVFDATVLDNANSFLYNAGLHYFTLICGNDAGTYLVFSKLLAMASLIAFFFFCRIFFGDSLFTALAVLLLATDANFLGMSHEIRGYVMGILFITLAAFYFYKFSFKEDKPLYLFLTGLFSVCAVLSHFLSVYAVLVFLCVLIYRKKGKLFSVRNIALLLIPVAFITCFFFLAWPGLHTMNVQNQQIQEMNLGQAFSLQEVFWRALKFTDINFKAVYPLFRGSNLVIAASFCFVIALYFAGVRIARSDEDKRNVHLLFAMGAVSSLFLALLCIKSHHYTALHFRYFSFCLPFCSLFIAYVLYVVLRDDRLHTALKTALLLVLVVPSGIFFVTHLRSDHSQINYNHDVVAKEIGKTGATKITIQDWKDAFLISAFLPEGYKIDYFRNPGATDFVLYSAAGEEKIPVIRKDK